MLTFFVYLQRKKVNKVNNMAHNPFQCLKKAHFAKALGVSNSYVQVNVERGKLVLNDQELIDITEPLNAIFIQNAETSGKKFDINRVTQSEKEKVIKAPKLITDSKPMEQEEEIVKPQKGKVSKNQELVEKKFKLEVEKLGHETKLKELQKMKLEGSLVPVDAAENLFIYVIETFHSTYQQEIQSLTDIFKNTLDIPHKKYVEIKKEIDSALLIIKETAKENVKNGVENLVHEYQEVRGRGEKK